MALLHPYQTAWLQDTSQFKAVMFARQTGKTFTAKLVASLMMAAQEAETSETPQTPEQIIARARALYAGEG